MAVSVRLDARGLFVIAVRTGSTILDTDGAATCRGVGVERSGAQGVERRGEREGELMGHDLMIRAHYLGK